MPQRYMRAVAVATFLLRVLFWIKCSYLHPDEHLQGPQVVANELYGWARQNVWDFDPKHAIRSHALLWLVYGFPMAQFSSSSNPQTVYYVVRAAIALFTWALTDMAVDRLCKNRNAQMRALILTSTSYVTWVHQSHTLSNSIETVLVLWFLVFVQEFTASPASSFFDRHLDSLLLALISVLGFFNRPTFLAFLALPSIPLLFYFLRNLGAFVTFLFGLVCTAAALIYLDTLLYGSQDWVVAPYNFVKYNIDSSNLSTHGLHPRWLHLMVNLPLLIGPGLLLLRPSFSSLPTLSTISGLVILSIIPHQEARFLMALVPLLCIQMSLSGWPKTSRAVITICWLAFNLIMGLLFGVMHQGGVVPALGYLRTNVLSEQMELNNVTSIAFWDTYMPPIWLLGVEQDNLAYFSTDGVGPTGLTSDLELYKDSKPVCFVDFMGASSKDVAAISAKLPRPLYFAAPLASDHSAITDGAPLIWETKEHLTFEVFDFSDINTFKPGLGVWLLN